MTTELTDCIIDVNDLVQLPDGATRVLLDCRFSLADAQAGERSYQQDHIPGAHYCHLERHLSGPVDTHGGRHPLPSWQAFSHQLQLWGIHPSSHVVVYDDQKMAFAARAWWLLKLAGIDQVHILNGGYQAWRSASQPVTSNSPTTVPSTEKASPAAAKPVADIDPAGFAADKLVGVAQVQQQARLHPLIDSREPGRYRGESEPIDPVAGHIPGAINKPWHEVTDDRGFIQPADFHRQRWHNLEDDQAIVYCGSGVTACVNLLSLQLAGKQARLYSGSWSDWCSYAELPVATGN